MDDLAKTFEQLLGSVDLFAPISADKGATQKKIELERPVTPINDEIKRVPKDLDQLVQFVQRRLTVRRDVVDLSCDDQLQLASIILAEVNSIWPDLRSLATDPTLTGADNHELKRRVTVHIVTVCQKLFEHYLMKANILNTRAIFSTEANMSRLRAQLVLDANKYLNILVIRRHVLADLTKSVTHPPDGHGRHGGKHHQLKSDRLPSHQQMIAATYCHSLEDDDAQSKSHKAVQQMINEMPLLDMDTLADIILGFPTAQPPDINESIDLSTHESADTQTVTLNRSLLEDQSRSRVIAKRSHSITNLAPAENLLDELGITAVERDRIQSPTPFVTTKPNASEVNEIDGHSDLETLTAVNKDISEQSDDLAPLLQAVIRSAQHDNDMERLKTKLQQLEERERLREEEERRRTELLTPTHPQPKTITVKMGDNLCFRLGDKKVPKQVCETPWILQRYPMMYNHLNGEIDSQTVRDLDHNLSAEDELSELYKELLKTLPKDHLVIEAESPFESVSEHLNLEKAFSSTTLSQPKSKRIVNTELHRDPMQMICDENTDLNTVNGLANTSSRSKRNTMKARTFPTLLDSFSDTINTDDYMKYLSTQGSDFLGVVFHLYNSDEEENDDAHGNITQTSSSHILQNRRKTVASKSDDKLTELHSKKSEYQQGFWNVNSVMMGGLGRNPPADEVQPQAPSKAVPADQTDNKHMHSERGVSYIISKNQRELERQTEIAKATSNMKSEPVKEVPIQDELESIWTSLQMPDSQKLNMAFKYSSDQYHPLLNEVVAAWKSATELILKRESIIKKLEAFERDASCPTRLLTKGSSGARIDEACKRATFDKRLTEVEPSLRDKLKSIEKKYNDKVTYQGRPYLDKMRSDRTEMLYWLQEERKANSLKSETQSRNLPPLPTTVLSI